MRKNSLTSNKGLSLSQAQSISNLCNQSAIEIAHKLMVINNYQKSVKINGEDKIIISAKPIPTDVVNLVKEKARLHACQAFLMENIKAKDLMLKDIRNASADISSVEFPTRPTFVNPADGSLAQVGEEWGWEQLSVGEYNEYLEMEAFAAHVGQFIHKDGILTGLRNELPNVPAIEWMTIKDGEKSPVDLITHHKSEELLAYHNEFATIHRECEQRVNYFKAKVKNLVTNENARIAKHNADLQNDAAKINNELQLAFETASKKSNEEVNNIRVEFEKTRQARTSEIAAMRISVDPRFQATVDEFLTKLPDSQE